MKRKFRVRDRVRVKYSDPLAGYSLQRDNRVGTIIGGNSYGYWLKMDKPIREDAWVPTLPLIPQPYAYFAYPEVLELLEPAKAQKPFNIWSFDPPKVKVEPQEERIPLVWGNKVLV